MKTAQYILNSTMTEDTQSDLTDFVSSPDTQTQEATSTSANLDGSPDSGNNQTNAEEIDPEEFELSETNKEQLQLAKDLLNNQRGISLAEATVDVYSSKIKQYIRHLEIENTTLLKADISDIRSFLRKASRSGYRKPSLNAKFSAIKTVYKFIRHESEEPYNIDWFELTETIDTNEFICPPAIERESLSDSELDKLKDELEKRDKLLVLVALETGARNIDVTKIKINDVDLENNSIDLHDTKNNDRYTCKISDSLSMRLKQWIKVGREATYEATDNPYLFPSKKGGRLSTDAFRDIVHSAAEDAGIQEELGRVEISDCHQIIFGQIDRTFYKVTPHAFRHTLSVKLQKELGLDAEERASILNQDSVETNINYYSENPDIYEEAVSELFD